MTVVGFLQANAGTWTLSQLARALRLPRREIERQLQEARLAGHPIVTSADGASWARDSAEVAACAAALRRRAINQLLTARALRRTAAQMTMAEGEFEAIPLW